MYAIHRNLTLDLSEQQQVDCIEENIDGCEGGWPQRTFIYAMYLGVEL